jgi:anti-sigma-K factor RskA
MGFAACAIAWACGEEAEMTGTFHDDLLDLAVPYALDAVSDGEREEIESKLASAALPVADAFYDEVRAVRETMAVVSAADAQEPPVELRQRMLAAVAADNVRTLPTARRRWRTAVLSAAAAVVVGAAAIGIGVSLRPTAPAPQSTAQQVFSAADVHTVYGAIPAGGTATVVFSRDRDAGVLVMNDVPPPSPGTVYQMWLVSPQGQTSAGTMDAEAVAPSTTAVLENLGDSTTLKFTVEPGGGSTQPTGAVIAELPLS